MLKRCDMWCVSESFGGAKSAGALPLMPVVILDLSQARRARRFCVAEFSLCASSFGSKGSSCMQLAFALGISRCEAESLSASYGTHAVAYTSDQEREVMKLRYKYSWLAFI